MLDITTEQEWQQAAEEAGGTYLLFKHSTTCPISAAAQRAVAAYEPSSPVPILRVRVIEDRPLSQQLAREFGIAHASPQAILVRAGKPAWHASHYDITEQTLAGACAQS
ncbi:MAG: bacillithiol system redox-active protein YtxJ [Firmicutes bacterium]|nr:bacillithiol system redox-active protein YtxJ [Bacillota bacterium]